MGNWLFCGLCPAQNANKDTFENHHGGPPEDHQYV